jgi:hypothetical protein
MFPRMYDSLFLKIRQPVDLKGLVAESQPTALARVLVERVYSMLSWGSHFVATTLMLMGVSLKQKELVSSKPYCGLCKSGAGAERERGKPGG